jgi:hypothetical protein
MMRKSGKPDLRGDFAHAVRSSDAPLPTLQDYDSAATSSRIGRASFFTALDATMVRLPA